MFYRKCIQCGSNLDPDERCDCNYKEEKQSEHSVAVPYYPMENEIIEAAAVKEEKDCTGNESGTKCTANIEEWSDKTAEQLTLF